MNKILAISLLMFAMLSCNDDEAEPLNTSCIPVKYVDGICGTAILQIQDENFFTLGETANGFDHVFFTMLPCAADAEVLNGETFSISIINKSDLGDCIQCLAAISYSGNKSYHIAIKESGGGND